uniref:Uncharacterized protein n=1 Tax=viral metagenome TaxID=1070528 RepID=A0A6M3JUL3_9ZZZZ
MTDLIPIGILLLVVVYQGVFIFMQKKDFSRREQDLLNRIMSRNYETYVQGEKMMEPPRPLTPEEIYEMERERGIPI